jgi:predicted nucleotidyltransferase
MPPSLSDDALAALVAEFVDDTIVAAALSGSHARAEADAFSDVDLVLYAHDHPAPWYERERLAYREGRLVSVSIQTFEDRLANLRNPGDAVFAVGPLRRARPIFDRDGSLAALQAAARAFDWAPLRAAADARAASKTEAMAEVAHKILGGMAAQSPERVAPATWELVSELTHAVAMRLAVLVDADRHYFRTVQEAAGTATAWSRQHRLATGLEAETTDLPPVLARGAAALGLYRETAALLRPILTAEQREVADGVAARIREAMRETDAVAGGGATVGDVGASV